MGARSKELFLFCNLKKDIPAVIAPGGLDTIAYIPQSHPCPLSLRKRKIYRHDFRWGVKPKEEVIKAVKWIGSILKETNPQKSIFLIPLRGWSHPREEGGPFHDRELIDIFKKWIEKFVNEESVIGVDLSINNRPFGRIACEQLYDLMNGQR